MKRSKLLLLWALTFVTGLVVGGACVRFYQTMHPVAVGSCGAGRAHVDLLLAQLEEAELPEGVREAEEDNSPKSSAELPSQLVRSDLPEGVVIGAVAAEPAEPAAGIVLSDAQNTVVLSSQKPAQRATDGSSITLIEAPVSVRRIKTLDAYKEFKRTARGSYPTADFAKEEVLVLESESNLPDKVFEIVEVVPTGETLKIVYRVNVFGLDKKTNTHSAQKINKTSLPITLEQVL